MAALLTVANRNHNRTGYWGPPNALHQFCEPHYASTAYVAEFYNSISSLVFPAVAVYALTKSEAWECAVCWVALAIVGLGSCAFHATMQWQHELWDEVPMVGFMATCMLAKAEAHPALTTRARRSAFRLATLSMAVGTVGAYVVLQAYEFFVLAFTGLVVVDTALALSCGPPSPAKWFCFCASVGAIITGKLAWEVRPHSAAADSLQPRRLACRLQPAAPECGARLCSLPPCRRRFARSARVIVRAQSLPPQVENRWCAVAPSVWPLHVMWHFLAAASAYYGVLFNILNRFEAGIRSAALPAAAVESGRLALRWAGLPYSVAIAPRSGRGASTPRDRATVPRRSPRLKRRHDVGGHD